MADFDFEGYRQQLKMLRMALQEADNAVDGLQFEHGEGGISSRAEGHMESLEESLRDAWDAIGSIRIAIEEEK